MWGFKKEKIIPFSLALAYFRWHWGVQNTGYDIEINTIFINFFRKSHHHTNSSIEENTFQTVKSIYSAISTFAFFEITWWRHKMETFSALLDLCEGNSPVTGGSPSQKPETRSFDVFVDLRLNKRLTKQSIHRWYGTPSRPSWRHYNDFSAPRLRC